MKERSKDTLHDAIRQLPEYTPRPDTWQAIDQSLAVEDQLSEAIASLPEREPRADTWDQLTSAIATRKQRTIGRAWWAAAAALLVFSLGVSHWWQHRRSETEGVITYREEPAPAYEIEKIEPSDVLEEKALVYIEQICQKAPPATCQRPEFQALQAHLVRLSEEERDLKETIEHLGYDPQLVKYQIRIENMKAEATKELIQMVIG